VTLLFAADLRYVGQQSELTVPLDVDPRHHHDAKRIVDVSKRSTRSSTASIRSRPIEWYVRVPRRRPLVPFNRA